MIDRLLSVSICEMGSSQIHSINGDKRKGGALESLVELRGEEVPSSNDNGVCLPSPAGDLSPVLRTL
jgi:hypothetical protein